jgi:hypothetical protein
VQEENYLRISGAIISIGDLKQGGLDRRHLS